MAGICPYGTEQARSFSRIDIEELKRAAGVLSSPNSFYHEPIPLTPKIIEKCGAIKADGEWQYELRVGGSVKIGFRFNAGHCYSGLSDIYLGGHLQYLHQLQNLYFALTGTELNVNL